MSAEVSAFWVSGAGPTLGFPGNREEGVDAMTSSIPDAFRRDGYATFADVLDAELIAEASRHVDWLLERNPGVRPEQLGHRLLGPTRSGCGR